jgi:S-formylglutathione hydrolase FrmB
MKTTLLTLALLVGLAAPASAVATTAPLPAAAPADDAAGTAEAIHVIDRTRERRVRTFTVSTPSLEMSSEVPLRVHVVLPRGYRKHSPRRYPVLYALPGTSNKADVWLRNIETLRLTRHRKLIVVIPDGTYNADGGGFYTNWVDRSTSRGVANWETFHTREVVGFVDQRFRTVRARSGRAIVGISQGGFGSLSYAARHPGLYGAAASFSGAASIWEGTQCRVFAPLLVSAIMTGLNGVQPFAPFGDPATSANNWAAHDPASQVERLADTDLHLYTSTGVPGESDLGDPAVAGTAALEAVLHQSNLCFKAAADAAGVEHGWHSYPVGTHAWQYGTRSLRDYLPRLMRHFRAVRPQQR